MTATILPVNTPSPTFLMVYAGAAPVASGAKKLQQVFFLVRADKTVATETPRFYEFKRGKLAGFRPGAVYQFSGSPESLQYTRGMMPVAYLDTEDVVQWTVSDRANRAAFEASERLLTEANQRPLREALDPIRIAYRRAPLASKAQMIADVVAYIVRGS